MINTRKSTTLLRSTAVAGSLAVLSLPALAGTPQSLTMVPKDSELVVVIPDLGELLGDMDRVNAMMGAMGQPELMMMTSMVRGMPGINLGGSAAIVLDIDGEFSGDMDAVVLLPISSFDDLTQGRAAVNGLVEMPMGDQPIYYRDIGGGFAAMSNDTDVLTGFRPASNTAEQAQQMLGTAGSRVADSNDLMVYLNLEAVRPMLDESIVEMEKQGEMVEMMAGPQAAQGFDTMLNAYKTAIKDGHAVVTGVNFDPQKGFAMDFGLQFAEGSSSASYFNNEGHADSYFDKVPQMDFFYAQAFDMGGEGIQKLFDGYFKMIGDIDAEGIMGGFDLPNMMKQFKGGAMVVGSSDIMGMTGLLANSVMYTEGADAEDAIKSMQKMYGSLAQIEGADQAGVSIAASFADEPIDVNGIQAYTHSMSFNIDPNAMGGAGGGFGAPDPAMIMQIIYGPSRGPSGYAAKAGNGMVYTFSQNADLLTKSVAAANGENTMMKNAGIAAASSMLPDNRVMEAYLGAGQMLNTAGPMLMMFGLIPEFEPTEGLTPLAFGATADGGGMMIRTVMPLDTLSAIMKMVPADAMDMFGGGGDDDWDEEEGDDDMSF
tara:strand:- start:305009 stop:306802 length:1794 start_codon:yes stop_codon:yes gene_type:complete